MAVTPKGGGRMSAPEVVAGEIVRAGLHLDQLDPRIRKEIEARLAGVLPGDTVQPALATAPRRVNPDDLQRLIRTAAVVAGGLDPALTNDPPPPLLWDRGGDRLLVQTAGVHAIPGDGLVDIVVPVQCDELGERPANVVVTFVTGSPDRPAGGLAVTEDHPRGPAGVIELWHEQLIAFAWHTFVTAMAALSHVGATDPSGRPQTTVSIAVSREGIVVTPMSRHLSDRFISRAETM